MYMNCDSLALCLIETALMQATRPGFEAMHNHFAITVEQQHQQHCRFCRALPVYLPVYLIPALLVHRKALLHAKKGPDIGRKVAVGAARSSLFLALYCTLCWRGACAGFQATRKCFCYHHRRWYMGQILGEHWN